MARRESLAALGEPELVRGYALAGARVFEAADAEAVRALWRALPPDISILILTPAAAAALGEHVREPGGPLTVVLPP